jgi:hypothetical protein
MAKKWTPEQRAEASRKAKERLAANKIAKAAAPPEPEPEIMPPLDGGQMPEFEDEIAVSEPPQVGMSDPFERFLADLDPETRELLTEPDGSTPQLRAIYEAEVKKAKDARREVAKKQAAARASRHAKTAAGLISPEDAAEAALQRWLNQKVSWTVEMQRDGRGHVLDAGYRVDGRLLYDGQRVTATRAEYLSYRSMAWLARQNEMNFQGKDKVNEQRMLSAGALSVSYGARA